MFCQITNNFLQRADITRSPNRRYQWPHKTGLMSSKKKFFNDNKSAKSFFLQPVRFLTMKHYLYLQTGRRRASPAGKTTRAKGRWRTVRRLRTRRSSGNRTSRAVATRIPRSVRSASPVSSRRTWGPPTPATTPSVSTVCWNGQRWVNLLNNDQLKPQ